MNYDPIRLGRRGSNYYYPKTTKMFNNNYLFITHRTYDNGKIKFAGIDQIIDFLANNKNNKIYLIEHPIESDYPFSLLKEVKKNKRNILKKHKIWPQKAPWRWLSEALLNIAWSKQIIRMGAFAFREPRRNVGASERYLYAIFAADALNVLSVLPLKIFNKIRMGTFAFREPRRNVGASERYSHALKIFFFSADFSEKRFNKILLDIPYRLLYKLSLKFADKTFVVSKRIYDYLAPKYPKKIIYLPNSPYFAKIPKIDSDKKNKFDLVFCAGRLTERVNLKEMFEAIKKLKLCFPQIKLHLIGKDNPEVKKLIKKYNIENNIKIYDFLTHPQTLKIISQSYIGISWYSPSVSHLKWGDSLKIREYAASGLPTVTDGITSTAQEMQEKEAGFIIKTAEEMADRIKKLIEDEKLYRKTRDNALEWAKEMDKGRMLEETFKKLF